MSVRERLRRMIDGMPPGSSISLPVDEVRQLLDEEPESDREDRLADLTIEELASEFDRSESAVRSWCQQGRIPGAYKLRNREWRIPAEGVRAFQAAEANGNGAPARATAGPDGDDDLGSWRDHVPNGNES